ncbi:unnamed protein product [Symbiodinium necroappetens]|uniref:Uncharacterized protein n=1 Tax=Symbiodinium necroappetens TaxID=1628268 RepID=A0A813C9P4_9DINO|nr:unnamed protein product [Symbiodinium necroappetens]
MPSLNRKVCTANKYFSLISTAPKLLGNAFRAGSRTPGQAQLQFRRHAKHMLGFNKSGAQSNTMPSLNPKIVLQRCFRLVSSAPKCIFTACKTHVLLFQFLLVFLAQLSLGMGHWKMMFARAGTPILNMRSAGLQIARSSR